MKNNKRFTGSIVALITFLGLLLLSPANLLAANSAQLTAAGCKTEHFLLIDLASAYKEKTGNSMRLGKTGNKQAVTLLLDNKVDFAYTCKPISKLTKKFNLDKAKISDWRSIPIAKDPIVVVSNVDNGVQNISVANLTRLFRGEVKNWQELGGKDLPVSIGYLSPEVESGVVLLFKEFTVGMNGVLDANGTKLDDPAKLGGFVHATSGGITFMALNSYHKKHGDILKINNIEPSKENILNGKYKLSATYYLTVPEIKDTTLDDFVKFSQSKEGQTIISKNFIPYSE